MRLPALPAVTAFAARVAERLRGLRTRMMTLPTVGLRHVRTRIVVFFAVLLALVQGASFLLVDAANSDNARGAIDKELATGERILQRALEHNRARLGQSAAVLRDDPALRGAIASDDLRAMAIALRSRLGRTHADVALVLGSDGRVVADTRAAGPDSARAAYPGLIAGSRNGREASAIALVDGRLQQLVAVRESASVAGGWIAIGSAIDDALARDLASVTSLDVSFVARSGAGPWGVLASTLPGDRGRSLAGRLPLERVARDDRIQAVPDNRDLRTRTIALGAGDGVEVLAVLQRSLGEAMARSDQLRTLLMLLAAVSLGGSLIGSYFIARGITRPLNQLAGSAARISRGDYSEAIELTTGDEIGALARALNRMREGIASHEKEILRLAYEDGVTGLPNRALFNDRLSAAVSLARRNGASITVMLMDLDRFKHINETLGHAAGDAVLRELASRLRAVLRESDTVARLGGDEFGIVLPTGSDERIAEVVRKVLRCIEQPIESGGQSLDVGASIGIARYPEHGDNPSTLISHADVAMYLAKAANSGYAFYDASHDGTQQQQLSLLGELRRAVERNELRMYFQPKIDLRTGYTKGVEALVRWMHPMRGIVPPMEFMPFAERTGFVRTVTRWVLETTLARCGEWLAQGIRLQVSINISVRDLQNPELPETLARLLETCAVPPELVCLEITESSFIENPQRATHTIGRLRSLGVRLSIDDFGTGFSSLAYLRRLRVHEMKIDRAFIAAMEDTNDMVIVRSTIDLAHNLGLTVVAEGIEDERSLARLRAMGCDEAQGYFMSRPLPEERLLDWLRQSPFGLARENTVVPLARFA